VAHPVLRKWEIALVALAALIGVLVWVGAGQRGKAVGASSATDLCQAKSVTPPSGVTDAYDRQVLSLDPMMYLTLGHPTALIEPDLSGNGHAGTYLPAHDPPVAATMPNGDAAAQFNGDGQYLQVPSSAALSVTHSGCLTVEAWIRPKTLQFPKETGTGYVYILGKGTTNEQEYALRMYSLSNSENPVRPNRISAYVFNLRGGLGSGSYFQDQVQAGAWTMITFAIDSRTSAAWPDGSVAIYKNGVLRGQVSIGQFNVTPRAASAPLRIATRALESYFEGAIGKVAVYDYMLTADQIMATYTAM
jgi:Concanavalin A-like lectin/glucanases superfamily